MPSLANMTVKKYDGTTDIVWTGTQSGGTKDRPATWQSATVGTAVNHRPELRYYVERPSEKKMVLVITCQYPNLSTDSGTGITSILAKQKAKLVIELFPDYAQADLNEFAYQFVNLLANGTLKQVLPAGTMFT